MIYGAHAIEWHFFWLKHLVPDLRSARDAEEMTRHVHRVAQWVNEDSLSKLFNMTISRVLEPHIRHQVVD